MLDELEKFKHYRERMNERILSSESLNVKRFFALDRDVYKNGALDIKTKELLGLVASTVLRCNDCILYHLIRCAEAGVHDSELHETLAIALVVGGSITIPHLRYAFEMIETIRIEDNERS